MSNPLVSYSQFAAKVLRRTKTRWNVWSSTSRVIFTLSAGLKSLSGFFFSCWVMPFLCYTGADCTCCLWVLLFHWPRCIAKQNPGQSGITECCQKQLIVICVEEHIEINNPSASTSNSDVRRNCAEEKKKDYLPPINQIRKASQIMKRIQNVLSYDNVFVWLKKERLYYRDNCLHWRMSVL